MIDTLLRARQNSTSLAYVCMWYLTVGAISVVSPRGIPGWNGKEFGLEFSENTSCSSILLLGAGSRSLLGHPLGCGAVSPWFVDIAFFNMPCGSYLFFGHLNPLWITLTDLALKDRLFGGHYFSVADLCYKCSPVDIVSYHSHLRGFPCIWCLPSCPRCSFHFMSIRLFLYQLLL